MSGVLVIRFSAMGDVALVAPVVENIAKQNPDTQFYILTKKHFAGIFTHLDNIEVIPVNLNDFKGFFGLLRLFFFIRKKYSINIVADLHNVIRSRILSLFFITFGAKVAIVSKNRRERKKLLNGNKKTLSTVWERYDDVFQKLGFSTNAQKTFRKKQTISGAVAEKLAPYTNKYKIIVAPFAAHYWKMYPSEKMKQLIQLISADEKKQVLILGNGAKEKQQIANWINSISRNNVMDISGTLSLEDEITLMSFCDIAITMDSANLHLAAWTGVPVISIWGATHPFAGFNVWQNNIVIQKDLTCRPCSIYGNKPCHRGDFACMNSIEPESIVQIINQKAEIWASNKQKTKTL